MLSVHFLFDQSLGRPPHYAGIIDDPRIPLQSMDGQDGEDTGDKQRCSQKHGYDSLLHNTVLRTINYVISYHSHEYHSTTDRQLSPWNTDKAAPVSITD